MLSRWTLWIFVGLLLHALPASAHKLNVFAVVDGKMIRGEAYFRGGTPVRDAAVKVLDPAGGVLGETKTNEEGNFTIPARFRCDHRVTIDADGHTAEYMVTADELPKDLPPFSGAAALSAPARSPGKAVASADSAVPGDEPLGPMELESLRVQVVELRKQLDQYANKTRFQDLLGGLGYILGLMGVTFYFLGTRRRERNPVQDPESKVHNPK